METKVRTLSVDVERKNFESYGWRLFCQYYALQILEVVIKTRWKVLPREQCEGESVTSPVLQSGFAVTDHVVHVLFMSLGIKKFIVGLVIKISSSPENLQQQRVYVGKLNMILVQVSTSRAHATEICRHVAVVASEFGIQHDVCV